MKCTHTIHDRSCHHGWNNANAPVLHIAPGQHSIMPPRRMGGNMDIRDLSTGTTLYLPVEVKGRLFSLGGTHAAQGDGEVCGTAISIPRAMR